MTLRYQRRDYRHLPDSDGHAIHCLSDQQDNLVLATCIHREGRGTPTHIGIPATSGGGVRKRFDCMSLSESQIVTDGLRLSRGMSEKSAALGETVGGAKTVVKWSGDSEELWEAFAREVLPHIPGYIMAEDSGTSAKDMVCIRKYAPQALVAGLTSDTDPSPTTADGVILGIKVTLRAIGLLNSLEIRDCSYAIKGVGAVGGAIVDRLWEEGVCDIRIADTNQRRLKEVFGGRKGVRIVPLDGIHAENVDVFVPCALGGSLNKHTIPELNCEVVAGCENNQLATSEDGEILHGRRILYAPDFVINGGGLIKVFSELIKDRTVSGMLPCIGHNLQFIFATSVVENRVPSVIAKEWSANRVKSTMFLPR